MQNVRFIFGNYLAYSPIFEVGMRVQEFVARNHTDCSMFADRLNDRLTMIIVYRTMLMEFKYEQKSDAINAHSKENEFTWKTLSFFRFAFHLQTLCFDRSSSFK